VTHGHDDATNINLLDAN